MVTSENIRYRGKLESDRGVFMSVKEGLYTPMVRSKTKQGLLIVTVLAVIFILLRHKWMPQERHTSAVLCKSKLIEEIWPDPKVRKEKIKTHVDTFRLENEFYKYLERPSMMCYDQVHFGPSEDGGYEVCLQRPYGFKDDCLVYSFGSDGDFRFEKDLKKLLDCEIHVFDPSTGKDSHRIDQGAYFHNVGLWKESKNLYDGQWSVRTFDSLVNMLGHEERVIDLLKIDIEYAEWIVLHDMMENRLLDNVRQLIVEVHTPEMDILKNRKSPCSWNNAATMSCMVNILLQLESHGFNLYYVRPNHRIQFKSIMTGLDRLCCYNLHYVNTKHPKNKGPHH